MVRVSFKGKLQQGILSPDKCFPNSLWGRAGQKGWEDQDATDHGEWRSGFCSCERHTDVLQDCTAAPISGGGKVLRGGTFSPVCPADPHVYGDRTPAESPKPSSQMPGSYCFSPFGCPAREESRQISSLGTEQSHCTTTLLTFIIINKQSAQMGWTESKFSCNSEKLV